MIKTDQFRKKLKVELDGDPYMMVDVDFVRPGKGQGFVRTKLKHMITGSVVERTFKSGEAVKPAEVRDEEMQFLYENGGEYTFMDNKTYEQVTMNTDQLGDTVNYIYEGINATISFFNDLPIGCEIANFVELEIVECEPGIKGNTATNTMKPAVVSTGYRVNVPLFVNQGEWIRIDTRTGDYSERCKRPEGR
ncbi:MAG: elongation factor P [Acidobacteriota bacterium]|nr:elongation factor P [Acidobacteriota bacterium]